MRRAEAALGAGPGERRGGPSAATALEPAPDLRQLLAQLAMSSWALSSLSCAVEAGLVDGLREPQTASQIAERTGVPPALVEAILEVLLSLRLVRRDGEAFRAEPALASFLSGRPRQLLQAELRSIHLQSSHLIESAKQGKLSLGWRHSDPDVLHAQGVRSTAAV